ncbi:MAG: GNAT family N-acetyltransferase [Chloroflexi bacterium]|nr:GNAT family N-acetyltransferase [Chloroflexota bacterium]
MTSRSFSVLVVYNKPLESPTVGIRESDAGILDEVEAVQQSLERLGYQHRQIGINSLRELAAYLVQATEAVVINLVEYLPADKQDASLVPTVCRAFGKTCTGNDSLALMLGLDKWRTKALLEHAGLSVPRGVLIPEDQKIQIECLPQGPYIVKPVAADASEGIDDRSIVQQADAVLEVAVQRIHMQFKQAALIEQYVGERELNISLLQIHNRVIVLPLAEIDFSAMGGRPHIVGYAAKWQADSFEYQHMPRLLPAPLSEEIAVCVRQAALMAWQAVGCQDYARVDMRLDKMGKPVIIEVNPNPDISPDAGFTAALLYSGTSYDRFIEILVENAWDRRSSLPQVSQEQHPTRKIRVTEQQDREIILSMLERSRFFRENEIPVALEVLDDALKLGDCSSYKSYIVEENSQALGWICYGQTPGTIGTYDIYWLIVEPTKRTSGLGSTLLAFVEQQIRAANGRLAVIETSGSDLYYPTRQFYLKRGYYETARLVDFYAPGDDKVVYTKFIAQIPI